jgi:hypothetical protein
LLFVMFVQAPIGEVLWPGGAAVGKWIVEIPAVGGMRGLNIVAALGLFVLAVRTFIGRERVTLGT